MELLYKGSVRALRGPGMAFANPEGKFNHEHMHFFLSLGIQDMSIRIDDINDEGIAFTIKYFNNDTNYFIRPGETIEIKKEGNAFGCELYFSIG